MVGYGRLDLGTDSIEVCGLLVLQMVVDRDGGQFGQVEWILMCEFLWFLGFSTCLFNPSSLCCGMKVL